MKSFTAELFISCSAFLATVNAVEVDKKLQYSKSIIEWVKSKNGFIHSALEMRHADPSDLTSTIGMFAKSHIRKGSLLFSIPNEVMIQSHDEDDDEEEEMHLNCKLVHALLEEIEKKDESAYAPYINYLLDSENAGQIPSAWSDAGKEMFVKALGDEEFNLTEAIAGLPRYKTLGISISLPPSKPISWIYEDWYKDCNGGDSELEKFAAMSVLSRSWDNLLIPLFDMLNHRNGEWLNTKTDENGILQGDSVNVYASRDIDRGEEIYGSYNMCDICQGKVDEYDTPLIFRDYGFVEKMPQSWIYSDIDLAFRMDELEEEQDGMPQYDILEFIDDKEVTEENIEELKEKLQYVQGRIDLLQDRSLWADVPLNEWEKTVEYMKAMELSIQVAIQWYQENVDSHSCVIDGTCTVSLSRYTDLDDEYKAFLDKSYPSMSCDIDEQFEVFIDGTFEEIDTIKSQYQQINFMINEENRDVCMDLDDTTQICDSYRPHYHEYMVHQTARFLPADSIKRVLFVGGGDSMLLHESLKYPSLELVVGLELDQKVTRGCFKHFGTQPHFDDDRVEWWFGDASKSLLMLPKDYFASFDLVLVDLSETVMSFSVSKELTVLEALTLLVKPGGIFVKNEVYFDEFKNMFPYTAQVTWRDNPVICAQVMVMGSRTVDFMNPISGPALVDHGVKNLVVKDLNQIEDDFELYHDYSFNATSSHLCDLLAERKSNEKNQEKSPGIMLVAEVEDVTGDLSVIGLKGSITAALKKEGMTIKSFDAVQEDNHILVAVVMKQGYIIARVMPDKKYVGLDIYFWSSMDKQRDVLNSLVGGLGGGRSPLSSYRVITGGMFGIDTWEEDESLRGPQFEELCKSVKATAPIVTTHDKAVDETDFYVAMQEGLKLIRSEKLKIAMLVGDDKSVVTIAKNHKDAVSNFHVVDEVITLNCPSMADFNRYAENSSEALAECERHLFGLLTETSEAKSFNAIVIDSTADKLTSSILLKVLESHKRFVLHNLLEKDSLFITTSENKHDDVWRKHLLLKIKDLVFGNISEAAFADIALENSKDDSEIHLLVTNYGVEDLTNRLNTTLVTLNADQSNNLSAKLQVLNGGIWKYQKDFQPSRVYLPDDYDQTESLAQWRSQLPTGHQAIVQMEPNPSIKKTVVITEELLSEATENVIKELKLPGLDPQSVKKFCDIGDGCLLLALYASGSLAVLWDGRTHIDVNLFSYDENLAIVDDFVKYFLKKIPSYTTMLRDEQPRGIGRVISYERDLKDQKIPHWAPLE